MRRFLFVLLLLATACQPSGRVAGLVVDEAGKPLPDARVRLQTTTLSVTTDAEGRFAFEGLPAGRYSLSAWAEGYYIAGGEAVSPGGEEVTLRLLPLPPEDNADYAWVSAFSQAGEEDNCQNCHAAAEEGEGSLPFDEWRRDPHANSARNLRFLTMYYGTDVNGNQSPPTRYDYNPDYGRYSLPPDPAQPYFGPGYRLDFPDAAGNCAACHLPAAAVDAPYRTFPENVSGTGEEGATCDFCHKVWDVKLEEDGLPLPNMPGVLSLEFRRPPQGHQFFAGPLDDVAPGEDTYAPLYARSQYCAACHFGDFWNVRIYNSFGEWLDSPYSNPETGQTCQDCHMPPSGNDHFVRLDKGGRRRDPALLVSHDMEVTPELLRAAVSMEVEAQREGETIRLSVRLRNTGAGHHVPTDSPLRQMILLVQAAGEDGEPLALLEGPLLPEWAGVGDPSAGYYAGLPGALYAKTLQEMWTEVTPTGAYWNPTRILSDTRLPALGSDTTQYLFAAPQGEKVLLRVSLLYRRAFITLADQKGWHVPDILMQEKTVEMEGN